MESLKQISVEEQYHGWRLDRLLSELQKDLSRSYLQKLIDDGKVLLNDKRTKPGEKVKERNTELSHEERRSNFLFQSQSRFV